MDLFDWILLAVLILCIALILLILWLGEPTRHPQLTSKQLTAGGGVKRRRRISQKLNA